MRKKLNQCLYLQRARDGGNLVDVASKWAFEGKQKEFILSMGDGLFSLLNKKSDGFS